MQPFGIGSFSASSKYERVIANCFVVSCERG
jgi:hypothetical protein